jgi:hypothetical protein
MVIAFDEEAGRTLMAVIALLGGLDMIDRLGSGANARSDSVATGAFLWRVLEYAVDMALFALQSGMHIPEQKTGLGMVKR